MADLAVPTVEPVKYVSHIPGVMVHIQTVSVEFSGIDNLFGSGILCGISLFYNNNKKFK